MYIPFDQISLESRIWIYQSDRALTSSEENIISTKLQAFTDSWQVHAKNMEASFAILYRHFIVIAANENINAASGCSIDDSVRVVKSIGTHLSIDFFNRSNIAFSNPDGVVLIPLDTLKQAHDIGKWNGHSLYFNNLIASVSDLKNAWLTPAHATWLSRYLPQQTLSS